MLTLKGRIAFQILYWGTNGAHQFITNIRLQREIVMNGHKDDYFLVLLSLGSL